MTVATHFKLPIYFCPNKTNIDDSLKSDLELIIKYNKLNQNIEYRSTASKLTYIESHHFNG